MNYWGLLALGLVAGVFAGMFGIGGGLVIVPGLMYLFKMRELEAIGTSLAALIPPVGVLGAIEHFRRGNVNIPAAALLAVGLFAGAWFGARFISGLEPVAIRRIYGGFLLLIAARMLLLGK